MKQRGRDNILAALNETKWSVHGPGGTALEIRPSRGFLAHAFESMFRADQLVFSSGSTLKIGPMTAVVKSVNDSGKPRVVQFTFEDGLEAPPRHWMSWKDGKLRSWLLPQVGETKELPGVFPF